MKIFNSIIIFLSLCTFLVLSSCQSNHYTKLSNGIEVTIHAKDSSLLHLRLLVMTDDIIRISATKNDSFSKDTSLSVIANPEKTLWNVEESENSVILSTSHVKATVSFETGSIQFQDSLGNVKLAELPQGGKTFIPETIDDKQFYSVRQQFQSPDDEAFYGLGQHQNNVMNYKGKDVDLTQYNIVAVVPYLVSSKNYGILWDNYSISKFGDPRAFKNISALTLYNEDGEPGGLTAKYYNNRDFKGIPAEKKEDSAINYKYLKDQEKFPAAFKMEQGSVEWDGYVQSDLSGAHKFRTFSAGYLKLWVDGEKIVDNWRQAWNPWTNKFRINMEPGKKYHIRIQWIPDGGESYVALNWLSPVDPAIQNRLSLYSEVAKQIDYYFVNGRNQDELISGYRKLTGKSPVMPDWAMGFWQSRERYKTQEELLDVVKEYRKRDIPLDNIVLDWQYWRPDKWGSHEFDPSRFPHPEQMIDSLHQDLNAHIMISVWPKFYVGTKNYEELKDNGWLYPKNVELGRKDWIGYVSTFYDAFNPDARKLYWEQINKNLNSKGIDAWWMDATEPDITSNVSIEGRKELMSPVALGPSAEYFNAYSLMNCSAIYNGSREANPNKRVFMLTRSAFAGQQRFAAATWSGDIASRWYDLEAQIPAGINFSMSGIPYWTMDIGGFAVERRYEHPNANDLAEWRELQTRWFQFGSFLPLFRSHGQFPYREIYNIAPEGDPAFQSMVHYDKLRYRLMPYIYSLAGETYLNDYTIMRGLIMDFPDDPEVRNIGDQYMFGPALMVCPVYTYEARTRKVYLPEGSNWYDLNSGALITGGQLVEADAPYTRMPVYIKEGSIIPAGKAIQYTGQKTQDTLTLIVYAGNSGHFNLYEDEGVNYNYEKGKYSIIPLTYNDQEKKLIIGTRKGEFAGMLNERIFRIQIVTPDLNVDLMNPEKGGQLINYSGKEVQVQIQ